MSQLFRIVYCSRNQSVGTSDSMADNVDTILATSRTNNARDGITGGLLFSNGCFAQVLEGPIGVVEGTFERIQCDLRHNAVTVLQAAPIATRDFPDWSMGFTGVAAANDRFGHLALEKAFAGQTEHGNELLDLLKAVVVRETEWLASGAAMVRTA